MNTQTKHTEGPWLVCGNQRNGHYDFVLPLADDRDFQANARLISAAPELLEACKNALNWIMWNDTQGFRGYEDLKIELKRAINKAEGK